jgi:hypothetical protein
MRINGEALCTIMYSQCRFTAIPYIEQKIYTVYTYKKFMIRLLWTTGKTCDYIVAEAYTTQPDKETASRVLYVYLACMAG